MYTSKSMASKYRVVIHLPITFGWGAHEGAGTRAHKHYFPVSPCFREREGEGEIL